MVQNSPVAWKSCFGAGLFQAFKTQAQSDNISHKRIWRAMLERPDMKEATPP
jgi:hypothetical protein